MTGGVGQEQQASPVDQLARAATRGASVTLLAQAIKLILQVVSITVLARLLTPNDYGLVAFVLVVVGFGEIFRDFGLSTAAIQSETITHQQRSNLFWINAAIGLVLAAGTFALSFPLAGIMGEAEVTPIAQVLACTFVANSLATQHRASLLRGLFFKKIAVLEISTTFLALTIAIFLAVSGFGYWALVAQQITSTTCLCIGVWVAARWRPARPRRAPMRTFLTFGWNLVASQAVSYVSSSIDSAIVGVGFGGTSLGQYNRASQLITVPLNSIRGPLTSVAVPVLSRARQDQAQYDRMIIRGQLALGYGVCTMLGLVAAVPGPIVRLALGDQWVQSAVFLRMFAIAAIFQLLAFVGLWVYLSQGLTNALLRYSLISASIRIVVVSTGAFWGPVGIAVAMAVAPMLSWPLSIWWLTKHTTIPTRALYAGALQILLLVGVAGAASMSAEALTAHLAPAWRVTIVISVYFSFLLGALVIPTYRSQVRSLASLTRHLRRGGEAM